MAMLFGVLMKCAATAVFGINNIPENF